MLITENLEIETSLAIYQVETLFIKTVPNRHISCTVSGVLIENVAEEIFKEEKKRDIHIKYEGKTIFRGFLEEIKVNSAANIHRFELSAYSYSKETDKDKHKELFQDTDKTYADIAQDVMRKYNGNVIIYDIDDRKIEKPLLCYEESAWEFALRMASNLKTYLYPDTVSPKPGICMGMKEGKLIEPKSIISEIRELRKDKRNIQRNEYKLRTYNSYEIGDCIKVGNKVVVLYEKEAEFKKGELIFSFMGMEKSDIKKMIYPFCNENIIGLSLNGKIKKYEDKKIYISLDIDKKEAKYGFDWYPETGNALYAIPKAGEKAELYVSGSKEGEMYVLRTSSSKGKDAKQKKLESGNISFGLSEEGVAFKSEDTVFVEEKTLKLNGNGGVSISAAGKITLKARNIRMNSKEEIACVSE